MIYYNDKKILIRKMIDSDVEIICKEELLQGWHPTEDKYITRLCDMKTNKSVALVAEYMENVAGYINIYFHNNTPEIVDFGVFEKYQRQGIGTKLMDTAEKIAFEISDIVNIAVGLHSGYGSAQRIYVKRGYIPDGKGVWYADKLCIPYESYENDDDLVLRFSKRKGKFYEFQFNQY